MKITAYLVRSALLPNPSLFNGLGHGELTPALLLRRRLDAGVVTAHLAGLGGNDPGQLVRREQLRAGPISSRRLENRWQTQGVIVIARKK